MCVLLRVMFFEHLSIDNRANFWSVSADTLHFRIMWPCETVRVKRKVDPIRRLNSRAILLSCLWNSNASVSVHHRTDCRTDFVCLGLLDDDRANPDWTETV
jgi:hypothetical protein